MKKTQHETQRPPLMYSTSTRALTSESTGPPVSLPCVGGRLVPRAWPAHGPAVESRCLTQVGIAAEDRVPESRAGPSGPAPITGRASRKQKRSQSVVGHTGDLGQQQRLGEETTRCDGWGNERIKCDLIVGRISRVNRPHREPLSCFLHVSIFVFRM